VRPGARALLPVEPESPAESVPLPGGPDWEDG
jgi:hypothetical protein